MKSPQCKILWRNVVKYPSKYLINSLSETMSCVTRKTYFIILLVSEYSDQLAHLHSLIIALAVHQTSVYHQLSTEATLMVPNYCTEANTVGTCSINVATTSWHCIDNGVTLRKYHVLAGKKQKQKLIYILTGNQAQQLSRLAIRRLGLPGPGPAPIFH